MPTLADTLRSTHEARANEWSQYRALLDDIGARSVPEPTAEERQTLDRLDASLEARGADVERLERAIEFERRSSTPATQEPDVTGRRAGAGDDEEYRSAFMHYVATGDRSQLERRALGVATDAGGGYAVPPTFRNFVRERMVQVSAMRDAVTVITTETGAAMEWPTVDETAVMGVILSENTQVAEQDIVMGTATLDAYKYSSKMVRISSEILQDSGIDLDAYVARALGERVGRITNLHFTVGTGTGQPDGIAVGATVGVTTAAGNVATFTGDNLIDLTHSVDPAYRSNGKFMMRDATIAVARRMKDTTGQYLWQPGMQAGVPDSLLGYPVIINQDMPAPAAGAVSVLFGDFRAAYVIREVQSFRVLRLTERFADFDQIALLGFLRTDGTKQDTFAYRALVQAAA